MTSKRIDIGYANIKSNSCFVAAVVQLLKADEELSRCLIELRRKSTVGNGAGNAVLNAYVDLISSSCPDQSDELFAKFYDIIWSSFFHSQPIGSQQDARELLLSFLNCVFSLDDLENPFLLQTVAEYNCPRCQSSFKRYDSANSVTVPFPFMADGLCLLQTDLKLGS
jgi:hypothetical protein